MLRDDLLDALPFDAAQSGLSVKRDDLVDIDTRDALDSLSNSMKGSPSLSASLGPAVDFPAPAQSYLRNAVAGARPGLRLRHDLTPLAGRHIGRRLLQLLKLTQNQQIATVDSLVGQQCLDGDIQRGSQLVHQGHRDVANAPSMRAR
jgi:hypothetical protein